jgi:hypothetical protein
MSATTDGSQLSQCRGTSCTALGCESIHVYAAATSALPSIAASAQQPKKNHALSLRAPHRCDPTRSATTRAVLHGISCRVGYRFARDTGRVNTARSASRSRRYSSCAV